MYKSWIVAVDSTQINGQWYRVWAFHGTHSDSSIHLVESYIYNVIEGIGCTNGVCYPAHPYPDFEFSDQLVCFHNRGVANALSNPVSSWGWWVALNFDNALSCVTHENTQAIEQRNANVLFFPNPINETSKIVFPYNFTSASLVVFNDIGQATFNITFQNKEEILIGDKINKPGIYFYRVIDNQSGDIFSGKFMKQ